MLDIKFLRQNPAAVRKGLADRGMERGSMARFEALDAKRRELLQEVETLKAERNAASKDVAKRKRAGEDAADLLAGLGEKSERIKALDEMLSGVDADVRELLLAIPNVPHESVPVGRTEDDNELVRVWGDKPEFGFEPKDHYELGTALGGLDFERAAKVTGARFVTLKGWAARMERALAAFMLDMHTAEHGYIEVIPPYMVNSKSMTGTGQLPKFAGDLFKIAESDYWLIPTAEVPVTNLHADETLPTEALPIGYCAYTPCFRSEAGSYGRDVRGIIRQHQFHKVELVRFVNPDESYAELEKLTAHAEEVLKRLKLHYRVVTLCTGDLGFASAKTYDLEVWLPAQNAYREISSCSNFEGFQARRAGIRCKGKSDKKTRLAHTLNGSGLAVGRTMVAILEQYQNADGTVTVPAALRPYMGGLEVLTPLEGV